MDASRGSAAMMLAILAEAVMATRSAICWPQFGARNAIIKLTQDGKPLPERDGPLRVVVPGETHHARWIRQVARLRMVRLN
jgi:DMSO/TMAO reductase YedYZ molybdopterin-dependent catalytic subunit